jgi:hypothetical protein
MFSPKIRITVSALSAAATIFASSAVASAAIVVRPGSVGVRPPIAQTTVTYLDPGKVGGAGQPGYDNAKCEQMANNLNNATNKLQTDNAKGDLAGVQIDTVLVESWATQISDHCLVID